MESSAKDEQAVAEARARAFIDGIFSVDVRKDLGETYDYIALAGLTNVRSEGPGQCTADLPVTTRVCNWMGNLHGGCTGETGMIA